MKTRTLLQLSWWSCILLATSVSADSCLPNANTALWAARERDKGISLETTLQADDRLLPELKSRRDIDPVLRQIYEKFQASIRTAYSRPTLSPEAIRQEVYTACLQENSRNRTRPVQSQTSLQQSVTQTTGYINRLHLCEKMGTLIMRAVDARDRGTPITTTLNTFLQDGIQHPLQRLLHETIVDVYRWRSWDTTRARHEMEIACMAQY